MDVAVGGPPGAYAPGAFPLTCTYDAEALRASPPPLLRDPPGGRLEEYEKQNRRWETGAEGGGYVQACVPCGGGGWQVPHGVVR